ncbi:MAG: DUF3198 domain-containing protein [Candidatus Thermoplasmatota archaeon]|jgi:p-aminobenzoyl-glutamate transporter AbgT|nr:DUF3198 domain-containing protein [Candidatus Thermoplasmatota archaeon]MCL5793209.1 DUF3198 domain-containing protein [Candidatus Thermoplasmatota archaeon]
MKISFRNYQFIIYIAFLALSAVIFLITTNDLLINNTVIQDSGLTLSSTGDWIYWIFALSFVFTLVFAYLVYRYIDDVKNFKKLSEGSSKQTFVKNLKKLEKIAFRLGPLFQEQLQKSKEKWNVR